MNAKLEQQVTGVLRANGPVKARQIATILTKEFGAHVDRSDINSILYAMKSRNLAAVDGSYKWQLNGAKTIAATPPPAQPTISFTGEQQQIIDLDPAGHLLIRGQAGSGKTTVLAARAGRILSIMNSGSLLFLTYNAALCAYVKTAFQKVGLDSHIDVKTFHDWANTTAKALGYDVSQWVGGKDRSEQLTRLIEIARNDQGEHRLYNIEDTGNLLHWWNEEIAWLFGQGITRMSEYESVERTGRGRSVRLPVNERHYVWCVFEAYCEWLEEGRREDYDNPGGLVLRSLMVTGQEMQNSLRYDHVLIDEVQDFDKSWLLAIAKVPRISLSLAGDLAQKIYRRSFTWSSVGIKVVGGRSRRLSSSHRTTQQIMNVAYYLTRDMDIRTSEDFVEPTLPIKQGPTVNKILRATAVDAYEAGYQHIAKHFKRLRTTTVAVAVPFSKQLYPAQQRLKKLGVTAERAKGQSLGRISGGVVITTYHQLKGLEFDHVVLLGLNDNQMPGRLVDLLPEEDQEEETQLLRRLIYVAMTRAKQSVTLVGAKPFCRFFKEVPDSLFNQI